MTEQDIDLEVGPVERPEPEAPSTAPGARGRVRRVRSGGRRIAGRLAGSLVGISAIGTKELRGRMRGRRAFVILTVYLVLLAGFAWMMELILERRYETHYGGSAAFASATIGQGIFAALMLLETLLVIALAPAFTAGTISLEREKQTLDMLATTPVSSTAIVLGKLLSALTYLFVLILASIPLTAIVFVFGGVAPDDVVRAYVVLLVTALGLGAIGVFFSALLKRTQAATVASYFTVLTVTLGAFFIFYFWNAMAGIVRDPTTGATVAKDRPPEALHYLNPFFAQTDVLCAAEEGFGPWCERLAFVVLPQRYGGTDVVPAEPLPMGEVDVQLRAVDGDMRRGGGVAFSEVVPERPMPVEPFGVRRDGFWPKSAAAWLILSVLLVAASVQLVSPTRRWRLRRPAVRRISRRPASDAS